ncbi:MAG: CocE/NonD family hydrolase [Candidatus Aminicenantes bacterium]|nr:CocE/NonD family hydrolase [Candidatus Aminicenantes bacterium]
MRFKLFLILIIAGFLLLPAAEEKVLPFSMANYKDSGTFKLLVNDSTIGTITYSLDGAGNYTRKFVLSMSGQEAVFHMSITSDKQGFWNSAVIKAPTQTVTVKRKGDKAEYQVKEKTYSVDLTAGHLPTDNYGPVFESLMLTHYDMNKKGKQKFSRFLMPYKIVDMEVEYKGTEIRKVKEKEIEFVRFDIDLLGILLQVWADKDSKIYMMNVPVQYAAYVRDGFDDLLKYSSEDPLLSKPQFTTLKKTVKIPMRDGVKLAADLYFPGSTEKKAPVILIRTPYGKDMLELDANFYSKRGYAVAVQDCRGRFASEGTWEPFIDEAADGYDSIEWLGTRPWSTGKVGMIGGSYVGWVQLWAASQKPPHLTTIIPNVAPPDPFYNIPYEYGTFYILGSIWWAEILESEATADLSGSALEKIGERKYEKILKKLPVIDLDKDIFGKENPYWRKWIKNNVNTGYWKKANFMEKLKDLDIPVFLQSGWFDGDAIGTKLNYLELKKSKNKYIKMIVGPWGHTARSSSRLGEYDFGKDAAIDLRSMYLRWFDYWLKGIENKIIEEPLVQLFAMFSNKWHKAAVYPLPGTEFTPFYLSSDKSANTSKGDGKLLLELPRTGKEFDKYVYDPGDPTPFPAFYFKSEEQEKKEKGQVLDLEEEIKKRKAHHNKVSDARSDILVYRTEALKEPLTVVGPLSAIIYASSSAVDTDWFVSLMDVDEQGGIMLLARGTIRARFRNSTKKPEFLEKNKVYKYTIDLWHTGITFQKGHRIRIEVSSALFPMFSRNLNTGGHNEMETKYKKAKQRIYHSKEYPSHLLLPVIKK